MLTVAIVYHSGFGHTDILARAVAQGVGEAGGTPDLLRIAPEQADFADAFNRIARADAVIFGSPTYMGTVSAPMKAFMDASARPYFAKAWKDKMAAAFTVSGSPSGDKLNTLQQLAIFAAQLGMHWVNLGLPPGHNNSASSEASMNRHGYFLGAAAQSDADVDADDGATPADLKTSAYLGARVARVALQLAAGRAELSKTSLTA